MHQVLLNPLPKKNQVQELNAQLKALYALLGAGPKDCFHYASSDSIAMQRIFFSHYRDFIRQTGRNHILTFPEPEIHTQRALKQSEVFGCAHKQLPLNTQGQLTRQAFFESVRPRSSLVSLPWAHGLTGVIQPLHDIIDICKENEIRLHVDATFALGKLFFRFQDFSIDYLTIAEGFLAKPHIILEREEEGSAIQLNTLVQTIDNQLLHFDHFSTETARLRNKLEQEIQKQCKEVCVLFQHVERLPQTAVIAFLGISSDLLLYHLHKKGIFASQGADGYFPLLSQILLSYGIEPSIAYSAVSFSLSAETSEEEIDFVIEQTVDIVKKIMPWSRGISL